MLLRYVLRSILVVSMVLPIEASKLNAERGVHATNNSHDYGASQANARFNFGPSARLADFVLNKKGLDDSRDKKSDRPIWKVDSSASAWKGSNSWLGKSKQPASTQTVSMPEPDSWLLLFLDLGGM